MQRAAVVLLPFFSGGRYPKPSCACACACQSISEARTGTALYHTTTLPLWPHPYRLNACRVLDRAGSGVTLGAATGAMRAAVVVRDVLGGVSLAARAGSAACTALLVSLTVRSACTGSAALLLLALALGFASTFLSPICKSSDGKQHLDCTRKRLGIMTIYELWQAQSPWISMHK